jgi:hypothetical protein
MDTEKKNQEGRDADILFSRTIKAGQRIYYIDVKQNRRGEMYLCITESKKMQSGSQDIPTVNYEKHKIFLFREDFSKFDDALRDAFSFVTNEQGDAQERQQEDLPKQEEEGAIKLDLDF